MTRAIIFDCFGVLATDGWLPFKRRYFGDQPAAQEEVEQWHRQVDAGLMRYTDYLATVAGLAGVPAATVRSALETAVANEELLDYIRTELQPRYKLGLLSNIGSNHLAAMFTSDDIAMFAAVHLSVETGYVKPDPRAYQAIAAQLAVGPEECIFIDDQARHCAAAEAEGMRAITYQSFEQMRHELQQLL